MQLKLRMEQWTNRFEVVNPGDSQGPCNKVNGIRIMQEKEVICFYSG